MSLCENDPITYFQKVNPTAPNPAPGIVTTIHGDNDYDVQVQNADDSVRTEEHVGELCEPGTDPLRYITLREVGEEEALVTEGRDIS